MKYDGNNIMNADETVESKAVYFIDVYSYVVNTYVVIFFHMLPIPDRTSVL